MATPVYCSEFLDWYNSITKSEYRRHYAAWRLREVRIEQEKLVLELLGDKHYGVVYDLGYGAAELSKLISHDRYIKGVYDDRQERLVLDTNPDVEIYRKAYAIDLVRGVNIDLVLGLNLSRNLDGRPTDYSRLWSYHTRRTTVIDFIASESPWTGLNDKTVDFAQLQSHLAAWQFAPHHYHEFPQDVHWYMGLITSDFRWLPNAGSVWSQEHDSPEVIEGCLKEMAFLFHSLHKLNLLVLGYDFLAYTANDGSLDSVPGVDVLKYQDSTHYDVILAPVLLSLTERPKDLAIRIVESFSADMFILGGIENKTYDYHSDSNGLSTIAYPRGIFNSIRNTLRTKFGHSVDVIAGSGKQFNEGPRTYIVVKTT